jgi:hypothetical protein
MNLQSSTIGNVFRTAAIFENSGDLAGIFFEHCDVLFEAFYFFYKFNWDNEMNTGISVNN